VVSRLPVFTQVQTFRCVALSDVKGQQQTHALQQSGLFRNWLSGVQLIEQRLRLLQIERVEAFGEPAID
jgi:hypothetical protein